jgi:hypothetical protein
MRQREALRNLRYALEFLSEAKGPPKDNRVARAALILLLAARVVVAEQAEDEGLWFAAETAPERYLQQALRRLHAAVEGQ